MIHPAAALIGIEQYVLHACTSNKCLAEQKKIVNQGRNIDDSIYIILAL